jgi:hypothetical protein
MKFSDLKFNDFLDGVSARVTFGDYDLSVVRHSGSYGGYEGLYEIGVFQGDDMMQLAGITAEGDTVKGWLTEKDVTEIMDKMEAM